MKRWRVGRTLGRSIYEMPEGATDASKNDKFIGLMENKTLADWVVYLHNRSTPIQYVYQNDIHDHVEDF